MPLRRLAGTGAWHAAAAYLAITAAATWPLVRGLGRDVPSTLGEPLRAMWALAWDCEQLLAVLGGDLSRLGALFDANVFHPAPLALAYSEHYLAQAVQVLPVYAATRNPILAYNLLFLSTFVLSGLGTFLLVRELTGRSGAAFLAGLLFAFAPFRLAQISHLQVLSAQWMPFVLYGLSRYVASLRTGRARVAPLAGAAAAGVALGLSSVYYLAYFTPFVPAYIVWEVTRRRLWVRWRRMVPIAVAGAVTIALTLPLAVPYAAVRHQGGLPAARGTVLRHSADVYSYATADAGQPVWGTAVRTFPKPEVELFPGLTPLVLALLGLASAAAAAIRLVPSGVRLHRRASVALAAAVLAAAHVAAIVAALLYRHVAFEVGFLDVSISNIDQLLLRAALLAAVALALSPAARRIAAAVMNGPGFFAGALLAAVWLSLGPLPQALGRPIELFAPYAALQALPGVDTLDSPSRFAMIAALMIAVLGGMGAAALPRRRTGRYAAIAVAALFLLESLPLPLPVNSPIDASPFNPPPDRVYRPGRAPALYHAMQDLPPDAAVAELPIGSRAYDLRAMYYSTVHWHRVLNGDAEALPSHYDSIVVALSDVPRHTNAALDALFATGATHVAVHEEAYPAGEGAMTTEALVARGATEIFRDGGDALLSLYPGVQEEQASGFQKNSTTVQGRMAAVR